MPTITSLGVGSGLDINEIVSQLVTAQGEASSLRLVQQEAETQAEISALGLLKSALSEFQSALGSLKSLSEFQGRSASSSNDELFTASADASAVAASYDIEVQVLAESQKVASPGYADEATDLGSGGTLTITAAGETFAITVDDADANLAGIRDAINAAENTTGVSATIAFVDDGLGGSEARLVLSGAETGTPNAFAVTVTDNDGNDTDTNGLSALVFDPAGSGVTNMTELQAATDALIEIDGFAVTRPSNTISGAIEGVTLELVSAAPGETAVLGVAVDESAVKSAIESFVTSFNSLNATLGSLSSFDPGTGQAGVLLGDATLRAVSTALRRELSAEVAAVEGELDTLVAIGITTAIDGSLSLDHSTLDAALDSGFDQLGQLFAGDNGIAGRLDTVISAYVQPAGTIDSRTDSLSGRIERINDQRNALNLRLASLERRLLDQFIAMDTLVSELQSVGSFLDQQFTALEQLLAGANNG